MSWACFTFIGCNKLLELCNWSVAMSGWVASRFSSCKNSSRETGIFVDIKCHLIREIWHSAVSSTVLQLRLFKIPACTMDWASLHLLDKTWAMILLVNRFLNVRGVDPTLWNSFEGWSVARRYIFLRTSLRFGDPMIVTPSHIQIYLWNRPREKKLQNETVRQNAPSEKKAYAVVKLRRSIGRCGEKKIAKRGCQKKCGFLETRGFEPRTLCKLPASAVLVQSIRATAAPCPPQDYWRAEKLALYTALTEFDL